MQQLLVSLNLSCFEKNNNKKRKTFLMQETDFADTIVKWAASYCVGGELKEKDLEQYVLKCEDYIVH